MSLCVDICFCFSWVIPRSRIYKNLPNSSPKWLYFLWPLSKRTTDTFASVHCCLFVFSLFGNPDVCVCLLLLFVGCLCIFWIQVLHHIHICIWYVYVKNFLPICGLSVFLIIASDKQKFDMFSVVQFTYFMVRALSVPRNLLQRHSSMFSSRRCQILAVIFRFLT